MGVACLTVVEQGLLCTTDFRPITRVSATIPVTRSRKRTPDFLCFSHIYLIDELGPTYFRALMVSRVSFKLDEAGDINFD